DSKDLSAQELGEEKQQHTLEDQLSVQMDDSTDNHENNNNNNNEADEDSLSEQPEETNPGDNQDLGETEVMDQDPEPEPQHEEEERDTQVAANSPRTPPSSPQLIPKLEQPATPPSEAEASPCPSPCPTPTPTVTPKLPKLRLNALLASDPALKPDAKELTLPEPRLLAPPPLIKPEAQPEIVEPLLKPARFMCLPCGIAFSSPSTLEAHQAYYCSHRNKDTEEDQAGGGADKSGSGAAGGAGGAAASGSASSEPPAKMARTGKQYACSQCSYSADKKVSLNRHMRMHQTSPAAPSQLVASLPNLVQNGLAAAGLANNSLEESSSQQQTDRYCSDCDIRFNNIKTYRAHKQHYCSSRRNDGQLTPKPDASPGGGGSGGGGGTSGSGVGAAGASAQAAAPGKLSPQARNKTPTPAMVAAAAAAVAASLQAPPPQPFLALPTHPIIIVPCSLIRAASIIPGPLSTPASGIVNPESTCFTVDNGTIKPLATALLGSALAGSGVQVNNAAGNLPLPTLEPDRPSAPSSAAEIPEPKSSPPEPKRKEAGATRESAPLDLSLRRSPISLNSLGLRQRHLRTALLDMEEVLGLGLVSGGGGGGGGAGKENVDTSARAGGGGSVTPEQIVCAPSLPSSPSMSPSPKRRAISPRSSGAGSAASMSPPGLNVTVPHRLDMLSAMLPADFGLTESLLAKTNPELALKLAAAAAAAAVVGGAGGAAAFSPGPATQAGNPGNLVVAGGAPGGGQQPQIYVKQGVSKCKECNIVFCKYENYLAHKQHYCSARNQESGSGDGDSKSAVSPSNPGAGSAGAGAGGGASAAETTPVAYQQLICAACGIKYTSLDNLRAHQNYYCPKGGAAAAAPAGTPADPGQLQVSKEKCGKCKTLHELGLPCPAPAPTNPLTLSAPTNTNSNAQPSASSNSVNKCPVCGVVSPTAALARKHMEMHGTVKAFRCIICQYKGNTLRGMRTHIRTHFDKKTSDVNEEHYMTCIFEEDSVVNVTPEILPSAGVPATVPGSLETMEHPPQLYNCDYCNYGSTYKGNVLRHMKLLHPHAAISSPSISPETRDQDVISNSTPNQHSNDGSNGDATSFHIKSEPLDAPPATLSLMHENNNSPVATPHIKSEPLDIDVALPPPVPPTVASPLGVAAAAAAAAAEAMKKYCSVCDISFNYVKTYLAHKQYYCKSKPIRPEANDSPSPNHLGSGAGAGGLALGVGMGVGIVGGGQQKNKENLQEAAI
ncbi:hypothetical protein KR018_007990, partial [Drosophila ironensis]